MNAKIVINDNQDLSTALLKDYSQEQIQNAKEAIISLFSTAATKVFLGVLKKQVPETIIVNMVPNNDVELQNEGETELVCYDLEKSGVGCPVFTIQETTIRNILHHSDNTLLESMVIHEMFQAADYFMLDLNYWVFDDLKKEIYESKDNKKQQSVSIALLGILQMFDYYRSEGIASLGEALLMRKQLDTTIDAISRFRSIFLLTMLRSQMIIDGHKDTGNIFGHHTTYAVDSISPIILLLVLENKRDISHDITQKALNGLHYGQFDLSGEEIKKIMYKALSLSHSEYIKGVMGLGDNVAPIQQFLSVCTSLQKDLEKKNVNSFMQLIRLPESKNTFDSVMNNMVGRPLPEEELDEHYQRFIENPMKNLSYNNKDKAIVYIKNKDKVTELYNVMKNKDDPDKQKIAQYALSYFFHNEDFIHDDITDIGLIDDLSVIDYALTLF